MKKLAITITDMLKHIAKFHTFHACYHVLDRAYMGILGQLHYHLAVFTKSSLFYVVPKAEGVAKRKSLVQSLQDCCIAQAYHA